MWSNVRRSISINQIVKQVIFMSVTNNTIFFRCDGGQVDGMGHIMQSLTLAQSFQKTNIFDVKFVTFSPDIIGKQKIEDYGFQVILSPAKAGSESDLEFMLKLLNQKNSSHTKPLLVADNRNIDEYYLEKCLPHSILIRITDQVDENFPCHVFINNSLYITKENIGQKLKESLILLGPKYNLINNKFFQYNHDFIQKSPKNKRLHLLITMGGEDPYNHTSWFSINLCEQLRPIDVTLIIGAAHPQKNQAIHDIEKNIPHATFVVDTDNMPGYMAKADLALTAGGNTCYELAAMGVPQIAIILEHHQKELIHSMEKAGCLISLGWYESLSSEKAQEIVIKLFDSKVHRMAMMKKSKLLFSEPGAPHIVSEIINKLLI